MSHLFNGIEDELTASAPAAPAVEDGLERGEQGKRKLRIRWLVIGAVVLALLVSCFFWYESRQNENGLDRWYDSGRTGL